MGPKDLNCGIARSFKVRMLRNPPSVPFEPCIHL
jgi:hypothetical protein